MHSIGPKYSLSENKGVLREVEPDAQSPSEHKSNENGIMITVLLFSVFMVSLI